MSPITKPTIEELGRVDTPRRSFRVQRERVVEEDGVRMRVSLVIYVPKLGGGWARDRSIGVKRCEIRATIEALTKALSSEPVVDERQGRLL